MSAVQPTQKMGLVVNPFLTFGILKHFRPVPTSFEHLLHFVALPQIWLTGLPVDWDKSEGVLPFGFAIH